MRWFFFQFNSSVGLFRRGDMDKLSNRSKILGGHHAASRPASSIPRIAIPVNVVICNIWLDHRAHEAFRAEPGFSVSQTEYRILFVARYS
jgi:hypothetical protein